MASDLADRLAFSDGTLLPHVLGDPILTRSIEHASILEVTLRDDAGALLLRATSTLTAIVDGLGFTLARVEKQGTRLTLTFEDTLIAALRRPTGRLSVRGGSQTLAQYAARLASDGRVQLTLDPQASTKPHRVLGRSLGATTSSWQMLTDIAAREGWRLFSDGNTVLLGSDAWLLTRGTPLAVFEHVGPVIDIGCTIDTGRAIDEANLTVHTARWTADIGAVLTLAGVGPADGDWLVASWSRGLLDRAHSTVRLQRPTTGL